MLSSNKKILKAHNVSIDAENKVLIDVYSHEFEMDDDVEEIEEEEDYGSEEEHAESIVARATQQSQSIIKDAMREAEELVQKATARAEAESVAITDTARETGYQEGMAKAQQEGMAIRAQAESVLQKAQIDRRALEVSLEPDLVELVTQIAAKLLGDTVEFNPQIILYLVKQGLESTSTSNEMSIRVSTHDYDMVADNKDIVMAMADGLTKLDIIKDLSLNAMDCVIETPYGNIDCSLDQQFEALRQNLLYLTKRSV